MTAPPLFGFFTGKTEPLFVQTLFIKKQGVPSSRNIDDE
jgi:hypothetical protein